jgi:hypothetical protein
VAESLDYLHCSSVVMGVRSSPGKEIMISFILRPEVFRSRVGVTVSARSREILFYLLSILARILFISYSWVILYCMYLFCGPPAFVSTLEFQDMFCEQWRCHSIHRSTHRSNIDSNSVRRASLRPYDKSSDGGSIIIIK